MNVKYLVFILSISIFSFAESKISTKVSLYNRNFDETNVTKANLTGVALWGSYGHKISENNLDFYIEGELIKEFGVSQDRFGENLPGNGINLYDAFVRVSFDEFSFKAGALGQKDLDASIVLQNQIFAGAAVTYKPKDFDLALNWQLGIPTSNSINDSKIDNEDLPLSSRVMIDFFNFYGFDFRGFHLLFKNPTTQTAKESLLHGNTVTLITKDKGAFKYNFNILGLSVKKSVTLAGIKFGLGYLIFNNMDADSSFSLGQEVRFLVGDAQDMWPSLKINYFFVESDATISTYNSYSTGHTNREGFEVGLEYNYLENNISVSYVSASPINKSFFQNDLTYSLLKWSYKIL